MASGDIAVQVSVTGTTTDGVAIPPLDKTKTFTSIADVYCRKGLITSTTVANLILIGTAAGATLATLNCLIVHNKDSTDTVILGFIDTSAEAFYVQIGPGETFVYMADKLEANATGGAFSAFADVDTITIDAVANTPRVDVLAF